MAFEFTGPIWGFGLFHDSTGRGLPHLLTCRPGGTCFVIVREACGSSSSVWGTKNESISWSLPAPSDESFFFRPKEISQYFTSIYFSKEYFEY